MKISIVVPVYNVGAYLPACLGSLITQDLPKEEYEIIVVNDGSSDDSLHVIQTYASRYSNIVVIDKPNGGLSEARNDGIAVAKGEYLLFVDGDDSIEQNVLGFLWDRATRDDLDVVGFEKVNVREGVITEWNKRPKSSLDTVFNGRQALQYLCLRYYTGVPFYLYRRRFLIGNNLSFVSGLLHEDLEFTPRAVVTANRIAFTDRRVYYHLYRSTSISHTVNPKRCFDLLRVADSLIAFFEGVELTRRERVEANRIIGYAVTSALNLSRETDYFSRRKLYKLFSSNSAYRKVMARRGRFRSFVEAKFLALSPSLFVRLSHLVRYFK